MKNPHLYNMGIFYTQYYQRTRWPQVKISQLNYISTQVFCLSSETHHLIFIASNTGPTWISWNYKSFLFCSAIACINHHINSNYVLSFNIFELYLIFCSISFAVHTFALSLFSYLFAMHRFCRCAHNKYIYSREVHNHKYINIM